MGQSGIQSEGVCGHGVVYVCYCVKVTNYRFFNVTVEYKALWSEEMRYVHQLHQGAVVTVAEVSGSSQRGAVDAVVQHSFSRKSVSSRGRTELQYDSVSREKLNHRGDRGEMCSQNDRWVHGRRCISNLEVRWVLEETS